MLKVEKATHLVLIALCILTGASLVSQKFSQKPRKTLKAEDLVGKSMKLPYLQSSEHAPVIVLGVSTSCPYCKANMSLYRKMAAIRRENSSQVPLIVISPDPVDEVTEYFDKNEVKVDNVIQGNLASLGIPGTPTLVALDSKGIIRRAFIGWQPKSGEQQLLKIMRTGKISDDSGQ